VFSLAVPAEPEGESPEAAFSSDGSMFANVEDGWTGIAFIETCVKSNRKKGAWTAMPKAI
jgi:hypothetical protein